MAQEVNLYISPLEGDGLSMETARKPILNQFLTSGDRYDTIMNYGQLWALMLVVADTTTHDAICADSRITVVLPSNHVTPSQMRNHLDDPLSAFDNTWRNNLKSKLETLGVPTGWATNATTMRELIKFLIRVCQATCRQLNPSMRALLSVPITRTISSFTAGERASMAGWLNNRGVDTSQVTGSTTVGTVLTHLIEQGTGFKTIRSFGQLEEF
jgi:hypothetical protein